MSQVEEVLDTKILLPQLYLRDNLIQIWTQKRFLQFQQINLIKYILLITVLAPYIIMDTWTPSRTHLHIASAQQSPHSQPPELPSRSRCWHTPSIPHAYSWHVSTDCAPPLHSYHTTSPYRSNTCSPRGMSRTFNTSKAKTYAGSPIGKREAWKY